MTAPNESERDNYEHAAERIIAVVVTYKPDLRRLQEQFDSLVLQVDAIVYVDNGSGQETLDGIQALRGRDSSGGAQVDRINCVPLGENMGVAAAQNAGIKCGLEIGASRILLMDHDSIPAADMVARLLEAQIHLESRGVRVAACGPRYLDVRQNNPPPFIRVRGLRLQRLGCPSDRTVTEVDYLIASGCLIPRVALDSVGTMLAPLFIDYVDIEWGLRARTRGFASFGVCAARMEHPLGDEPIRAFGRAIPSHSPMRHYYIFRNGLWLQLHGQAPAGWKLVDAYRSLLRMGFYALFSRPRSTHIRAIVNGLCDGLRGRLGSARWAP